MTPPCPAPPCWCVVYAVWRSRDTARYRVTLDVWSQVERFTKAAAKRARTLPAFVEALKPRFYAGTLSPRAMEAGVKGPVPLLALGSGAVLEVAAPEEQREFMVGVIERADQRAVLRKLYAQWHCQPIARWLVDEVWAVIAGMGLPYNPAYDEMAAVGVRRDEQRIGALPLAPGWVLERVWPGMYRDLVGRYGPRW